MPPPSQKALVPFISVDHMMQLINHIGLEQMLTGLASAIEDDFKRWQSFDKTPRIASHSAEGVIELMPTADETANGFKYVNGHPKNTRSGLQTATALGLSADVKTGYPVLLTEMTLLTALRTAATSAVAAKYLAPKAAGTMAMIGNGAQSEFQTIAMKAICGITCVRLYDIDPTATAKAAQNLAGQGIKVIRCSSPEHAIEGAQIITTCTADKQYATILTDNMIAPGFISMPSVAIVPAKRNCTGMFCSDPIFLSNIHHRHGLRVKFSNLKPPIPSQSSGGLSPVKAQAAQRQSKSPCSTA